MTRSEMEARANALLDDVKALFSERDARRREDRVLNICAGYRQAEMLSLIVRLLGRNL